MDDEVERQMDWFAARAECDQNSRDMRESADDWDLHESLGWYSWAARRCLMSAWARL